MTVVAIPEMARERERRREEAPPARTPSAKSAAQPGTPQAALAMQRAAGNQATGAAMASGTPGARRAPGPNGGPRRYTVKLWIGNALLVQAADQTARETLESLKHFRNRLYDEIRDGIIGTQQNLGRLREEQPVVAALSSVLGGANLPDVDIWDEALTALDRANVELKAGRIDGSTAALREASAAITSANRALIEYREGSIKGAGRAEVGLEVIETAAAVTLSMATGGLAGVALGAGYGATQKIARQGSELAIGLRKEIDWAEITFDTLFGVVTGVAGGAVGNKVLKILLKNKAVASVGRKALSHVVSDLVAGRISSLLQTAAHQVFDDLSGKKKITTEGFIDALVATLTDPKQIFFDVLLGAVQRKRAAAVEKAVGGGSGGAPARPATAKPAAAAAAPSKPAFGARARGLLAAAALGIRRGTPSRVGGGAPDARAVVRGRGSRESFAETSAFGQTVPSTHEPAAHATPHTEVAPGAEAAPVAETPATTQQTAAPAATEGTLELNEGPSITREVPEPSPVELEPAPEGSLELNEGPNETLPVTHNEFEPEALSKETNDPNTFGEASNEHSGTHRRVGTAFNELNAGEIVQDLRVDYDSVAGRPNSVEYRVDAGTRDRQTQSSRYFGRDRSTSGAQARSANYRGTGRDQFHLGQREAFKGDRDVERAADLMTNIVPGDPNLNRGAGSPWRAAEERTLDLADQHGSVRVKVEPIYDANPPRLANGTPIPKAIRRTVTAPDGRVLEDASYLNR
jgi:DNA/RNA endonuclease G (NUC1)